MASAETSEASQASAPDAKTILKTSATLMGDGKTEQGNSASVMGDGRTELVTSTTLMADNDNVPIDLKSPAEPSKAALEKKTDSGKPDVKAGPHTDQLSDMTDDDDEPRRSTLRSRSISTFYRTVLGNPRLKTFALINTVLITIILLLVLALISFAAYLTHLKIQIARRSTQRSNPCMFRWSEWGACSASCKSGSEEPYRTRTVLLNSIVRPRGNHSECPDTLKDMVDTVPCNLHLCPENLSSYSNWTRCFYWNVAVGPDSGCYRMRVLPRSDQLIYIDTTELYQNCSEEECYNLPF
ncbi:hypothetical protein Tcan_06751 [Toxocara canis]|uniref:Uncharacterized protein n=1 Tax=Toxocara canis TaxID=6265 RepID=A0A0B2W5M5_TOXCA|nr:hypothetical protein Tcan_06751 [Toxocara canis]